MKIYYREKSGGIEILRCFGIEGRVEIPGMIDGKLVISAAPYAFSSHMDEKEELKKEVSRFFGLPENGEIKPVFYIELDGKLYFGFTPRLRLFYEKEIYDGLSKEQRDNSLDYCKSMFGFATDNESYRSRLSFQESVIVNNISEN